MIVDPRAPVIVGVGQESVAVPDDREPVEVMADVVRTAVADSGADITGALQSIRIVSLLSWRYRDPGRLVADRLRLGPVETAYSSMGGNTPQMLVNTTALEIVRGGLDGAVIAGCELWRTRMRARSDGGRPPWTIQDEHVAPTREIGVELDMGDPFASPLGIGMPVQVYPMMESGLRHAAGRTIDEHRRHLGRLWARFSEIAAANPHAWVRERFTPDEVIEPSTENRMIGAPYPKRLNSNNMVDQAAAVIIMAFERAEALGVPRDRMVFVHAGTDANDTMELSARHHLHRSAAINIAGRRALGLAGVGPDGLRHVDLYSCFPSSVQATADEIGLGHDRDLTVTGGLCFAGGPWNNYVSHAIAAMTDRLRAEPGLGLVSANGGYLTKHAFGVYGTDPPSLGFRHEVPQAEVDRLPTRSGSADHVGPAAIEAYTVMHDRDQRPETAFFALLTPSGERAWATSSDAGTLAEVLATDVVGRTAELSPDHVATL